MSKSKSKSESKFKSKSKSISTPYGSCRPPRDVSASMLRLQVPGVGLWPLGSLHLSGLLLCWLAGVRVCWRASWSLIFIHMTTCVIRIRTWCHYYYYYYIANYQCLKIRSSNNSKNMWICIWRALIHALKWYVSNFDVVSVISVE